MARLATNTEQPAEDTPNSVAWWSCWRETSKKRITYRDFGEQTKSLILPLLFPEVIPHLQFGLTSVRSCKTHGEIQEPNQQNQIKRIEGWTM